MSIRASSREIAAATRCERRNVVRAIDALSERGLIATREGTRMKAAAYQLRFAEILPIGGVATTPPPAPAGVEVTPQVVSERPHGGVFLTPPPTENKEEVFPPSALLIDQSLRLKLDRALSANSRTKNRDDLQRWRELITDYAAKVCRVVYNHPPAADTVAMIMDACNDSTDAFYHVVREISLGGSTRHESPIWWLFVCLQRLEGIAAKNTKARMAELAAARRPRRTTGTAAANTEPAEENFSEHFSQRVAAAAAGKRIT